jgi:RimJ/RimL family protein N-acetyltransferase
MQNPLLETERLWLRSFSEADIPELVPLIGAREVAATTLRIPHPYDETHAREYLAGNATSEDIRLAITLRAGASIVGGIGLHPNSQDRHAEIGYWIGVPFWGQGYATEAARALVKYGFEELKLERIFATHFQGNSVSGNVLRKLGMRHEGCMRRHVLKWERFLDVELYGILRDEWWAASRSER